MVSISFTAFDGSVTSVPYPFHSKMAKVQLSSSRSQARRTSIYQRPQMCSSSTTANSIREMRPVEALSHLRRQVLGRILQRFSREAVQVRFDEPDDATLIRATELPQNPAHTRLDEPLLASQEMAAVVELHPLFPCTALLLPVGIAGASTALNVL